MTTSFRGSLAGLIAAFILLALAIPEAESHARKKQSCTEGDANCWIKPAIRSSCNFWDADCASGRRYYYHDRYKHYYHGYSPSRHKHHDDHHHHERHHHHADYEPGSWSPLYWETRFYHRRYANYRKWGPRHYTWIQRDYSYEGPQVCLRKHREIGDEMSSRAKALTTAERRWAHAIGYDKGSKFGNLDRAKEVRTHCDPTGQSRWLKKALWTCVVTAVPCRANRPDQHRDRKRFEADEVDIPDERIDR